MNREKLFKNLEKRYTSKRDMISRIPLGVNPDSLWQELLNLIFDVPQAQFCLCTAATGNRTGM